MSKKFLSELGLKGVYRTSTDNLLEDFYTPCLASARTYDRAVGFFSSSLFSSAFSGISEFIKSDSRMRLIIGHPLSDEEYDIVESADDNKDIDDYLTSAFDEIVEKLETEVDIHRYELFKYLVYSGRLQIKFAIRVKGMYHEKIGIFRDDMGNEVVFQGSANETDFANSQSKNFESIMVFNNWSTPENIYYEYTHPFKIGFEKLWKGSDIDTLVVDIPSAIYKKVVSSVNTQILGSVQSEIELEVLNEIRKSNLMPSIPEKLNGMTFSLKEHQKQAIDNWAKIGNEGQYVRGILRLATGSGKTITSICCAIRLYNMLRSNKRKLAFIVAVPYDNLAEQWVETLRLFNFSPIKCYRESRVWENKLANAKQHLMTDVIDHVCIVVVNKTLSTDRFSKYIDSISEYTEVFFLGDECHNHASTAKIESLPNARYRMGLSATPFYDDDNDDEFSDVKKMLLTGYYGDVVANYTLEDALSDQVLTPYKYNVYPAYLNEEESLEYIQLSVQISKKIAMGEMDNKSDDSLMSLFSKRSRLIANITDKIRALESVISKVRGEDKRHTLFYCGDGSVDINSDETIRQVDNVAKILTGNGWNVNRFTSTEGPLSRVNIMSDFKNTYIDGLVAIRVLDEGIDVPVCKSAYILASSKNPRQYIQRRGRILRKYPGKEYATINDFMVIPSSDMMNSGHGKKLIKSELKRIVEFNSLAINSSETNESIKDILKYNDINIEELEYLI
ncbi:DEAD/DEAH box helicase family protein [Vibrio breoganii]|uniref:DEAD/DEAH box helicase family protein n=1 Tax=Vibrio breoganii TaxID=553239 RepID=UPI000C848D1F|nr:DEAD/DEAH box helicase family protein [Vibrio breoganii]PMH18203.1 hypothetical protein BCU74_09535 [Vibrio breoganii]PMM17594.1 hypothetical protein BCT60_03670 [Vibrio breoganii]